MQHAKMHLCHSMGPGPQLWEPSAVGTLERASRQHKIPYAACMKGKMRLPMRWPHVRLAVTVFPVNTCPQRMKACSVLYSSQCSIIRGNNGINTLNSVRESHIKAVLTAVQGSERTFQSPYIYSAIRTSKGMGSRFLQQHNVLYKPVKLGLVPAIILAAYRRTKRQCTAQCASAPTPSSH